MLESQRRAAKSVARTFARLQAGGRFARQWGLLVPAERKFVAKTTYTSCMAPFHSPAKLQALVVVGLKPVPARSLKIGAVAAALVTVRVRSVVAGVVARIGLPVFVVKVRRHWYWMLAGRDFSAYAAGNCPEAGG